MAEAVSLGELKERVRGVLKVWKIADVRNGMNIYLYRLDVVKEAECPCIVQPYQKDTFLGLVQKAISRSLPGMIGPLNS